MKNTSIRKMAVTLATLQALTLSGCKSNNIEGVKFNKPVTAIVQMVDDTFEDESGLHFSKVNINEGGTFIDINDDNIFDINENVTGKVRMYNKNGRDIGEISGYHRVKAISTNGYYTLIELDNKLVYVSNDILIHVPTIIEGNYELLDSSKEMVVVDRVRAYDNCGKFLGYIEKGIKCHPVATNNEYTLVNIDNKREVFILSDYLTYTIQDVNMYGYVYYNTKLYRDEDLTIEAEPTNRNCIVHVSALGENTAVIEINDNEKYYIDRNDLKLLDYNNPEDFYAYVPYDTQMFCNMNMDMPYYVLDNSSLVRVINNNGNYAEVFDLNNQVYAFVPTSSIVPIDNHFIDIDLSEQRMTCFNGEEIQMFRTRSGNDNTPTHTGVNYIDWKAENWEFTTFPGCYARHWIAYDENHGEGIHDLIGDDQDNYGNHLYHEYGSHGCVRTTDVGSEYVYNNYGEGDLVLVHK